MVATMVGTHKRNGVSAPVSDNSLSLHDISTTSTWSPQKKRRPRETFPHKTLVYMFVGCVAFLGSIQLVLNAVLSQTIDSTKFLLNNKRSLSEQVQSLQTQLLHWQQQSQIYIEDGNFYPFSIRDSRRLVPTQLPLEIHIWDYVDITSQNQQRTRQATLFHNAKFEAKAVCQTYDLICYKKKIIQVFDLVLQQNPSTSYFFYMEADNELCVPLTEIRRIAYQYERYFITTGIGFSGWIMQRQFMVDFLQELKDYVPPPKDPNDILDQQGPHPSEGPDPIASVMLIDKNAWTVTRKYLVSHSIQPSIGTEALTVRVPVAPTAETPPANGTRATPVKPKAGLEKHLPRCLEPRRSKWRISKKDHRDRFGWDYFDYDECDGEVFPCYVGQLEELLAKDMSSFNYTELDLERQKMIEKQENRRRQKLLTDQRRKEAAARAANHGGGLPGQIITAQHQHQQQPPKELVFAERAKLLTEKAKIRNALVNQVHNAAAANDNAAHAGPKEQGESGTL